MRLRPYQQAAVDAVFNYFAGHPDPADNCVLAMPTGTGKSPVLGSICHKILTWWPGQRVLMLVHTRELVQQNAATMRRIWPQAPLGVFSAGLRQRVAHMPITFAGTKSVAVNLNLFGRQDLIIVDEAHLISENEESEYRKVLAYFKALNPNLRIVGLSATPFRMGLGMITDGSVFTHVAFDITGLQPFNDLLDQGYLAPLIPMQTRTGFDLSGVKKQGGEFVAGALEKVVNREELTRAALGETVRAAADRNHWLIFAAGIEHAESIQRVLLDEFGIASVVAHSKMGSAERDEALRRFKAGEVRALVNMGLYTTGFDFPALDCIVSLRPTNSVVLHIQMLGRGTRPFYADGFDLDIAEGRLAAIENSLKRNCLILDFAGNVLRCGPINDPRIPKRKGEAGGEMPVKLCDECGCLNHISARVCDNCGEPFAILEKITETASTAELIAKVEPPRVEQFTVNHIVYSKHTSPGKPAMLKASYHCGVQRFTELVLLEHYGSGILNKAHKWWRDRSDQPEPGSVDQAIALEHTIRPAKTIGVWINKKLPNGKLAPEVRSHQF